MKRYDIIVPHFNAPRPNALAPRCVMSIRQRSRDYRVIWVQNGGAIPAAVARELDGCEEVLPIMNATNLGFVKAVNMGLRMANAPRIVLLNNDTTVPHEWLPMLAKPLENPLVGMTGPLSSTKGSWQGRTEPAMPHWVVPPWLNLAFFCVMTRRDVVDAVGPLDEQFGPGLGDDDDYSIRLRRAGYQQVLVTRLKVHHHHRTTFKSIYSSGQIHDIQTEAVRTLRRKHGEYLESHPAGGRR